MPHHSNPPLLCPQTLTTQTIKLISCLSNNRHILSNLPITQFGDVHQQILGCFTNQLLNSSPPEYNLWYLIGTEGCHLCQQAQQIINTALATLSQPPSVALLDLAESNDDRLLELLGRHIPILITPSQLICYPFGLMDILNIHQR